MSLLTHLHHAFSPDIGLKATVLQQPYNMSTSKHRQSHACGQQQRQLLACGHHRDDTDEACVCSEVIDAMFQPSRYDKVYPFSYMYTYFVTVPHSFMTQLAFPADNKKYSEFSIPTLVQIRNRAMMFVATSVVHA